MEANAKYIFVGASLIILVTVFVIAAIWLTGAGREGEDRIYAVLFRQQNLAGLQIGSDVTMRGIKIAKVQSLRILPAESQGVRVTIRMNDDTPVRANQVAVIQRNILTGLATIELQIGPGEPGVVQASADPENAPLIPEGKDPLQSLKASLEEILMNANTALVKINGFITPENQLVIEDIMKNVRDITRKVSLQLDEFKGGGAEILKLLEDSRKLVEEITTSLSLIRDRAIEGASALRMKGTEVSDSVEKAAGTFSTTVDRYKDPQRILFGPDSSALGPGEGGAEK